MYCEIFCRFNDRNKKICSPKTSDNNLYETSLAKTCLEADNCDCLIPATTRKEVVQPTAESLSGLPGTVPDDKTNVHWEDFLDDQLLLSGVSDIRSDDKKSPIKLFDDTKAIKANNSDKKTKGERTGCERSGKRREKCELDRKKEAAIQKTKSNYRKKKYTTVVKRWLNDIGNTTTKDDTLKSSDRTTNTPAAEVTNEEQPTRMVKRRNKKRFIQSQLVNVNEVMKFRKPTI